MSENLLTLTIDGHEVKASADSSIIQAYARAGSAIPPTSVVWGKACAVRAAA